MASKMDKTTGGFRFFVEVDGSGVVAHFNECNLAGWETEVIEYREGGDNMSVRKLIGVTRFSNICLLYTSPSPRDRQKSRMPSSA